jgi:hypothetical protein
MKHAKENAKPETAVEVKKETGLSVVPERPTFEGLVPSDIVIPKILLMQGLSDFVAQRKAQLGDIVRSTTCEKLGSPEKTIDIIPLSFPTSQWVIELKPAGSTKFEYKKMVPRDAKNSGLPWSFLANQEGDEVAPGTPNAIEARRVQRLACYALLPADIEADLLEKKRAQDGDMPDLSKALMPVLVAFRSLSFQAGKEIVSFFTQAASFKTQAWRYVIKLGCKMEQNDKGTFYIFTIDRAKPVPSFGKDDAERKAVIEYWANVVSTTQLKVDESQPEEAGGVTASNQF